MDFTTVDSIIQKAINNELFPGAALGVGLLPGIRLNRYYGRHTFASWSRRIDRESLFDLASLTKPLATTLSVAMLKEREELGLHQCIGDFFTSVPRDKKDITVESLLTHSSGLPAWKAIYNSLPPAQSQGKDSRLGQACKIILQQPLSYETGKASVYSDLGFMLLGRIVELVSGQELWPLVHSRIYRPLGLSSLGVSEEDPSSIDSFVPSGFCPVRKSMSWGRVNDLNAWTMGGLPGHAGLFSNLEDVLFLTVAIMNAYTDNETPGFAVGPDTIRHFLSYRSCNSANLRALGFDRPSPGKSTCGNLFSKQSVGHLGYTGTSFWIDMKAGLSVVFLCARTFPFDTAKNRREMKRFRIDIHTEIRKALARTGRL